MAAAPFGDSSSRASGAVWRQWGSIEARKWTALPLRLQERLHRRIRRRSIDCRSPGTLIPVFKGGVALVSGFLVRNPTMQEPKDAARVRQRVLVVQGSGTEKSLRVRSTRARNRERIRAHAPFRGNIPSNRPNGRSYHPQPLAVCRRIWTMRSGRTGYGER